MIKLTSLAALKRFMQPGQKWSAYNSYGDHDFGVRELAHVDTVKFGFRCPQQGNRISYCDWPRAKQLVLVHDPNSPDHPAFRINYDEDGNYLFYKLVKDL